MRGSGRRRRWEGRGTGRRCSKAARLSTTACADVERVLVGEDVGVIEDVAVAFHVERLRLRAGRSLLVRAVEIVLEGDVIGVEVVAEYVDSRVAGLGAARALTGVVDQNRRGWIWPSALQSDVGLIDDHLFAVGARSDEQGTAGRGNVVDGGLHGGVIGASIRGYAEGGRDGFEVGLAICGDGKGDCKKVHGGNAKSRTSHRADEDSRPA